MKKIALIILLMSSAVMAKDNSFNAVESKSSVNIILSQGNSSSVIIEGTATDKFFIRVAVVNHRLVITNDSILSEKAVVKVVVRDLNSLVLSGDGNLKTAGVINTASVQINITGGGDALLNLHAKSIDAKVTGAGNLKLKGNADRLIAMVVGTGYLRADELYTRNSVVESVKMEQAVMNHKYAAGENAWNTGFIMYPGSSVLKRIKSLTN